MFSFSQSLLPLEHENVSNNGISSPPAGIGDVRYFVDITVPLTEPPSDFMKK